MLYGREGLKINLPPGAQPTVIAKRPLPRHENPQAAIESALANPVGAPAFDELVRGRKSACILICDITRPVPNHLFLRPLIEGMLAAGDAARAHHGAGGDRTASPERGRRARRGRRRPVGALQR